MDSDDVLSGEDMDDGDDELGSDAELLEESGSGEEGRGGSKGGFRGGGHFNCADYDVFSLARLEEQLESRAGELAALLAVDTETATQLLLAHGWREERANNAVLCDRRAALAALGITEDDTEQSSSSSAAQRKRPRLPTDCPVCFDQLNDRNAFSLRCGHAFCAACWADHLKARIDTGDLLATTCIEKGCKCRPSLSTWERLLGQKAAQRWRQQLVESFYQATMKDTKPCPKEGCDAITSWHSDVFVPVRCICGFSWCYKCHDREIGDHAPASCEEVEQWNKKFKSESDNVLWIKAMTRQCPKCRSHIEKNGGCMHMTCRKCKHEFCWVCFADWRGHSNCNSEKKEVKERMANENAAKTELERYTSFLHRFEAHKKAADVAARDRDNIFDLETFFIDAYCVSTQDLAFLRETLSVLVAGRLTIAWAYVRDFYANEKRINAAERNMWQHHLSEFEMHVDRLQEQYEKGRHLGPDVREFLNWKRETANFARVAKNYFDEVITAALKGDLMLKGGARNDDERFYSTQLEVLSNMGFRDKKKMVKLLEAAGGNVETVVQKLIN